MRVTIGRILLLVCSLGALSAVLASASGASSEDGLWRTLGLAFFAVVFALLAWRPWALPGLWEAAMLNKLALTIGLPLVGAPMSAVVDGLLTALLLIAYVLCRGWRAWSRRAGEGTRHTTPR